MQICLLCSAKKQRRVPVLRHFSNERPNGETPGPIPRTASRIMIILHMIWMHEKHLI